MSKKFSIVVAMVGVLVGLGISSVHSALTDKGLIHPVNHFPTWFSDSNGIALQLCLDGDGINGLCFFDPVIPGNATSEATGFGSEAFWWLGSATLDMPGGGRADLVLALEAAYGAGDPAPNDQFAFGRVRIRVDVPVAGEYKIWHPFLDEANGCEPEVYNATAGRRAINVTRDIGGGAPFETMLNGEVGPFLTWDPAIAPAAPAGYVGDPSVDHEVIGGHCGINYFRIEGPTGTGNVVETNLFSVQGKIYDEANALPGIEPVRTSYFRTTNTTNGSTTARINAWVKAPPSSTVMLDGLTPAGQNGEMAYDGQGTFYKRSFINADNSTLLPEQLIVTATNPNGAFTQHSVNLVDQVSIQSAVWSKAAQTLKVVAFSSDKINGNEGDIPELTLKIGADTHLVPQVGAVGRYEVTVPGIAVPPARVTVSSSKGGVDTEGVSD